MKTFTFTPISADIRERDIYATIEVRFGGEVCGELTKFMLNDNDAWMFDELDSPEYAELRRFVCDELINQPKATMKNVEAAFIAARKRDLIY